MGKNAQQAADIAIHKASEMLVRKYGKCGDISIVCCDVDGNYGSATTTDEFSYVVFTDERETEIWLVTKEGSHEPASKEWIDNYFAARNKKL